MAELMAWYVFVTMFVTLVVVEVAVAFVGLSITIGQSAEKRGVRRPRSPRRH